MKRILCAAAAWIALAGLVQAGVVIEMETKDLRNDRVKGIKKIYAQGEMLAMQDTEGHTTMIFRGDSMLLLDHRERSYTEIDEKTMQDVVGQLNAAMKQMEEQLAKLPPAQREMMEKAMKGRMPAMEPVEIRVEPGESQTVGDYSCRMYSVYLNDEKSQEMCAAPLGDVEAASEAWGAFQAMARFSEKLMESVSQGPLAQMANSNPFGMITQIDGFPVLTRTFVNGRPVEEGRLTSISRQTLDPATFEPPQGYRRKDIQDAMRGK